MKYKGIELVEITEPQIFDPPKKMLVWNADSTVPYPVTVLAIVNSTRADYRVVTERPDGIPVRYEHCAEIPKPRRATLRELAKWCAQGNGQIQDANSLNCVFTGLDYGPDCDDRATPDIYKVRKWDDTEWHEPTVDYMGI